MGINLWILYEDLREFAPKLSCRRKVTECPLTYFSFYQPGRTLDVGCLYVVTPEQLAEAGEGSFLCLGEPDSGTLEAKDAVLWGGAGMDTSALLAKLSELFHSYMGWLHALEQAVHRRKPLDEFGKLSLPVFRRPITLFKYNFFVLFSVYDQAYGPLPEAYYQYTAGAYLNDQIMGDIEENGDLSEAMTKRGPYLHTSSTGIRVLCINLWEQDRFVGVLQVDEVPVPVSQREFALIHILGEILMRSIRENSQINFSLNSDLQGVIYDLLEHSPVADSRLVAALGTVGWRAEDTYACIVCRPVLDHVPENALFMRGETLTQRFPCSIYVVYQNQILLFCNQSCMEKGACRAALKELRELLSGMQFLAGVSGDYESFYKSGYFYEAAVRAIAYGLRQLPRQSLYYYEAYMVEIFRDHLLKDTIRDVFIPQELLRLIQYDRQNDGDYCKVLRALLCNNMSCTDAAQELFTHRNTVLNRLNRMKEHFHMNLNSYTYRLKLMIAFEMLEEGTADS